MDRIDELLTRGVANIIPSKKELGKLLRSGKKLNVYLGIDPTATQIHLGHTVPLRKLQTFAKLEHNVTFLIGDFTALVGDTSDKDTERPVLTPEQIQENFKTYKEQAQKLLDFSKVKIKFNSEWLNDLDFKKVLKLCFQFSLNDFISRELIKKRLADGKRVGLHETFYPLMQGYDSFILDTDVQIGGTDQTFNMQTGRTLQKNLRGKESFVLATEFLSGTDGRKMSKTWGNAIWLTDTPSDMYAKVMAIRDDLIIRYYTLATNMSLDEIEKIKSKLESGENPMAIKKGLARRIVTELHDKASTDKATENFGKTVQKQELPADIPVYWYIGSGNENVADFLVQTKLALSRSEAKRIIGQSGVEINGSTINNQQSTIGIKDGMIIKVGKRKFIKIKTAN